MKTKTTKATMVEKTLFVLVVGFIVIGFVWSVSYAVPYFFHLVMAPSDIQELRADSTERYPHDCEKKEEDGTYTHYPCSTGWHRL